MTEPRKRICVFTPTQRPGLDITYFSLKRQTVDAEILWVIADELYDERWQVMQNITAQDRFKVKHFKPPKDEGSVRNLAKSYNMGLDIACNWDADIFVSLQDYIYVPSKGLQGWLNMDRAGQEMDNQGLYTGICCLSSDPEPDQIHDLGGMFTIFNEPFDERPKNIDWYDVRFNDVEARYANTAPIEWETNWAAISAPVLYDDRISFDEEYDKAVAFENQDYAYKASQYGYNTIIDFYNQTLGLPHKKYFADEWAFEEPLTKINQKLTMDRYGK